MFVQLPMIICISSVKDVCQVRMTRAVCKLFKMSIPSQMVIALSYRFCFWRQ